MTLADLPHRRQNLLTGEWLLVSPHRAKRPWQGDASPPEPVRAPAHDPNCHLCPGNLRATGEANPAYDGTFVFTNDFAALLGEGGEGGSDHAVFRSHPATGEARVICFAPDHGATLARMPVDGIARVVDCWCSLSAELGAQWAHVQLFENKGAMMGASSPHPHGQVWASDFVPELPGKEDTCQREWLAQHGTCLLDVVADAEIAAGDRVVEVNEDWLAFVPFWAAWPFETMVVPLAPAARLEDLDAGRRQSLAHVLSRLLQRYDALFSCDFPYSMGWHGAPHVLGDDTAHWRLHAHFNPPLLRSASVRKHMVGFELLAETQRDITPESAAQRLREAGGGLVSLLQRTREAYASAYGVEPEGVVFVPGRVNLIGEHVDYNGGLVLPMPIAAGTAVAWGRSDGAEVEAIALDLDLVRDSFVPGEAQPHSPVDWRSYLRGTASALVAEGLAADGVRLAVAGSIPRGSGLSSSASFCVAIGRALVAAMGNSASAEALALAAQSAEHNWAGVRCGIMDQMAVAAGESGCALLLDCADLAHCNVPLPQDWAVMIVQSGVRRGLVDGHYNQRRADCETAAMVLQVPSLRHARLEALDSAALEPVTARRARHVIEEIARVREAADAIAQADLPRLGELMRSSHASLRDLFEVSEPNVDQLVDVLNAAIGLNGGARMTGGGFGGAVVAVLPKSDVARVRAELEGNYTPPSGAPLDVMIETAGRELAGECL